MNTTIYPEIELNELLNPMKIIRYLTRKKFSGYISGIDRLGTYTYRSHLLQAKQLDELKEQVKIHEANLRSKSNQELEKLYQDELDRERKEIELRETREELQRFFNAPSANADSDHWSKADYWTIDEAIALSFGKEPDVVKWDKVAPYTRISAFAKKYSRLRELALRAAACKEFGPSVLPANFIEWTEIKNIGFDEEIKKKVYSQKKVTSWKIMYDNLKKIYEEQTEKVTKTMKEQMELNEELYQRNLTLQSQLLEAIKKPENAKPLHKKEKDSILKMLAGLIVVSYTFESAKSGNLKANEIQDDILRNSGIEINDDTVRKYMREAIAILPQSLDEQN